MFRNVDADIYQQVTGTIAVTIAVHARKTLATQTEYLTWLSARLNLHLHLAVNGRNFYRTTECSRRHAQQEVVNQVVFVTNQIWVAFFLDDNQQVAGDAVVLAGITLAVDGQLHAFSYTCRNLHFYHFFAVGDTFARAMLTLFLDDLTFTITVRADSLSLHHAENALLCAGYTTGTVAIRTSFCTRVAFCTTTVTMFTSDIFLQLEFLFNTGCNVLQVHFYLYAKVRTAEFTLLGAATTATKTTESAKASESAATTEDVAEHREDIVHRHTLSAVTATGSTAHSGMTELVVTGTFVLVAQYAICFSRFLELLFRFLVTWILVRVILDGHFTIGFLDFGFTGRFLNA